MSKNLTRKGLALGAVVALGATIFAGTPAFAAGEVVLAPNAGTTNSVFATDTFTLNASLAAGQVATNISQLKYKITNNTALPVAYTATGGTGATGTVTVAAGNATVNPAAAVGTNTLALSLTGADATTATSTVTVLAFIDSNSNGLADAGEYQTSQTVTFVKSSEVTATTTLTAPQVGDSKLVAHVTLDKSINVQQIGANDVTVSFAKNGTAIASTLDTLAAASGTGFVLNGAIAAAARKNGLAAAYDSTAGDLKATFYPDSDATAANTVYTASLVSAGIYSAQASIATVASGSVSTSTVVAPTLKSYTIKANASADAKNITTASDANVAAPAPVTGAATVRSGAYGATVVANFLDNATTAAAVAGQSAIVTVVPSNSVIAADGVTVNGTAVGDGAGTSVTLPTLTTDAAGNVTLNIAATASDDADALTITVKVEGYTTANYVVTFRDTAYSVVNAASAVASGESVLVAGTKVVNYVVADQFGTAPSGDYRLNVVRSVSGAARTTAATWNYVASLASGKASVSIVDNGAGVGADTVTATLQKAVAGGGYADVAGQTADSFILSYVLNVTPASATIAATADGSTTALALEAKDFVTADTRFQNVTIPSYTNVTHVYGVVSDSTGAALAGVPVTASAAGLLFQAVTANGSGTGTGASIYGVDSLTVLTNASGQYEFSVFGHSSGAQTVSVTAGTVVKTQKLTFATATAAAVALSLPTSTQTGRAVDAVATVTDKFGNAIAGSYVKFVATGVGAINGSSVAIVATDSTGKASVKLVIGANETGDAVVTATSVTDSTGATATTDVAVKTATVTAGLTDAQIDIVNNRVTAVTSFSKGKTVSFYVDGIKKWSKLSTADADVVLYYNLKKGPWKLPFKRGHLCTRS